MKFKRLPADFQVEEEIALAPSDGPFALYRLQKESLGTREAIQAIARKWKLPISAVALAGLKDKHALTMQYLTIRGGPRRGLSQTNLELQYVGQAARPIHSSDIRANRFAIIIRELVEKELQTATDNLAAANRDGVPNYFDRQRFGSLGVSGEFIAQPWCLGDYERALWLAIADDNVHDRPAEKDQKRVVQEHWGDWRRCRKLLRRSPQAAVVSFLAENPTDFRRAIALAPQDLRSLWLAAFQSDLWNAILAELIRRICAIGQCSFTSIGRRDVPLFQELDEQQRQELQTAILPLPSARLHLDDGSLKSLYDDVLAAEGIELRQIRVKYPRDSFFSKGERAAVIRPANLIRQAAPDELYPGCRKLTLRFTLPRGAYATMLVKRLLGNLGDELDEGE